MSLLDVISDWVTFEQTLIECDTELWTVFKGTSIIDVNSKHTHMVQSFMLPVHSEHFPWESIFVNTSGTGLVFVSRVWTPKENDKLVLKYIFCFIYIKTCQRDYSVWHTVHILPIHSCLLIMAIHFKVSMYVLFFLNEAYNVMQHMALSHIATNVTDRTFFSTKTFLRSENC